MNYPIMQEKQDKIFIEQKSQLSQYGCEVYVHKLRAFGYFFVYIFPLIDINLKDKEEIKNYLIKIGINPIYLEGIANNEMIKIRKEGLNSLINKLITK